MKPSWSGVLGLAWRWAPRLMRTIRVLSVVAIVISGAARAADDVPRTSDPSSLEYSETVYQFDLAGPRLGATFSPDGSVLSQFGWHFESQASGTPRGPWLIVEKVFLVGGLDQSVFIPNASMVFGMRLPNSFEFGLGPSATIDMNGLHSGLVLAAGHSFRMEGIRVPVNVACAFQRGGEVRWTLITGWAIRDLVGRTGTPSRAL